MTNGKDMDAPVTRRELQEELVVFKAVLKGVLKAELDAMEQRIDRRFDQVSADLQQLSRELAQHANAILEEVRGQAR